MNFLFGVFFVCETIKIVVETNPGKFIFFRFLRCIEKIINFFFFEVEKFSELFFCQEIVHVLQIGIGCCVENIKNLFHNCK